MRSLSVALLALTIVAAGCGGSGPSGVKIKGKVVRNGTPVASPPDEPISLTLSGTDAQGKPAAAPATVQPTGEFVIEGVTGQGVPAGEYTVIVTQLPYGPKMAEGDRFKGLFKDGASKLKVTVPASGSPTLTVDVAAGTATLK